MCPICRQPFVAPAAPAASPVAAPVARPIIGPPLPGVAAPMARPLTAPPSGTSGPLATPTSPARTAPPIATGQPPQEEAEEEEPPVVRRRGGFWLQILLLFIVAGVVVAGVLAVVLTREKQKAGGDAGEAGETVVDHATLPSASDERWVDATKVTLSHHAVKVKVLRADYGPVRTRDEDGKLIIDEEHSYLTIALTLRNTSERPRNYRSWYGSKFRVEGKQRTADLHDSEGREYPFQRFPRTSAVQGHVPDAVLERPGITYDAIIFEVPADVDRSTVDALYLELPGQAFESDNVLRFRIPTSMIEGW